MRDKKVTEGPPSSTCDKGLNSRRRHIVRSVFLASLVSVTSGRLLAFSDESIELAFDKLSDLRSRCYQDVRQVKNAFKDSDKRYKESERLFDIVRAASDAWIDQARLRLIRGRNLDDSSLRKAETNLSEAVVRFRSYVSSLFDGTPKSGSIGTIAVLAPVLADIVAKLHDYFEKRSTAEREHLVSEFERMRFAAFRQI